MIDEKEEEEQLFKKYIKMSVKKVSDKKQFVKKK